MLAGYVRVLTIEHNISAKSAKRPKFEEMMNFLREGDELIVSEFSRLARSTTDLLNIVETLTAKKIKVRSLQRQREGIQPAKAAGKYKGRHEKKRPKDFDYYKQACYERTTTATEIAKHYKVSRPTVYKWLRE